MTLEEFEKDKESGETKRTFSRDSNKSPIAKYFDGIEDAPIIGGTEGLACVGRCANIGIGILCGIKDEQGNKKYFYNTEKTEAVKMKEKKMINLASFADKIFKASGKQHLNIRFFREGVECKVGDNFKIDGDQSSQNEAVKAAVKEANRLALEDALSNLVPISAFLGAEGFMDPHRKLTVAGENIKMRQAIEMDMAVYKQLKEDFDMDREDLMAAHKAEMEEFKRKMKVEE